MLRQFIYLSIVLLLPLAAHANRVALLVGHASYAPETKLSVINSAANDVRGVRDVLVRSLGFNAAQVKVLTDPSRDDLIDAIDWLEQNSKNAESVVFYYSGHGVSDPLGENYMLPVRGRYETLSGVQQRGVSISSVVDALKSSKPRKSLLIFDACRSVVLAKSAVGKGLAGINLPVIANQELIVHFAAQPNSTADDGTANGYSPYTHSLLKFLPRAAELGLQDLLDMVRDDVTRNSQSGQRPQRFGEIASNTVLVGNIRPVSSGIAQPIGPNAAQIEQQAWEAVQRRDSEQGYRAYLSEYPQGRFAPAARVALQARVAPAGTPQTQTIQTVKIGHVAPLSGNISHLGKDNENGVRMAIDEMNIQGITIAGNRIRFEIQAEDDAANPQEAVRVAQRLCDAKVAGVVGHLNSGTTIPASRIYNGCGIPHITGAASNPNLTKPGYKTTYRIIANDNSIGAALAVYAAEVLRLKRVAIIDDRTAYGSGISEAFKRTALSKGMQIVDEQYTTDRTTEFMGILNAVKGRSPEAIFFGGMDSQAGPMLRQMELLGMSDVKYFGGDGICTSQLGTLANRARTLENVMCAEGGLLPAKMPSGQAWMRRYDAKFPGQFQVYSPYTYDATYVLVDAMKRANSVDPSVYTAKISETNFKGVTALIAFDRSGELINPGVTMFGYRGGIRSNLSQ